MTPVPRKPSRQLTPTQRRIVALMHKHGPTRFSLPGFRRHFRSFQGCDGFYWIGAYQSPEFFLKARGIIEPCGDNAPGAYQLSDFGTELANTMKEGK